MSLDLIFGQLVIGPPGSGKTTYCHAMGNFLESLGRKVAIVNIDPANDNMEYKAKVDISELIKHSDAMEKMALGPNGALVYCMEYLEQHADWLIGKLRNLEERYVIIDCPGQIELYTHNRSMANLAEKLGQNMIRLCSVHLMDSHYCSEPSKYLSAVMTCTSTMLHLALPHVNVMTKLDQMKTFSDRLAFNVDFYTEVLDLEYLLEKLDQGPITSKFRKLNAALVSLIEDYSLVSFVPLDVNNKELLLNLKKTIDKVNGFIYGGNEPQDIQSLLSCAIGAVNDNEKLSSIEAYF